MTTGTTRTYRPTALPHNIPHRYYHHHHYQTPQQRFARAAGCRRKALLAHFGEDLKRDKPPAPGSCCDFCDLNIDGAAAFVFGFVCLRMAWMDRRSRLLFD